MTHFVVKVIQLYLWPELQQIIIFVDVNFCRYSWYGKTLNRNIHSQ